MALNVTTAVFGENCNTATASPSLAQWDKGQVLQISGVDLPDAYQVEFSTVYTRNAIPVIGNASGVQVPNELLQRSAPITACVVLHSTANSRETEYWVTIHITPRKPPETITPDPEQQDVIDQTIAALQDGTARAEAAATAAAGSATAADGSAEDAEAWAVGQRAGEDVPDTDPTYQNNAKYYAGAAEAAAEEAGQHEASWESWVRRAEAAADDAEGSARAAAGSKADATAAAQTATQKATEAGNSAGAAAGSASEARQTVDGAIGAINTARDGALNAIGSAGSNAVGAVEQAGTMQTGRVTTEGNTQVNRVQTKGDEVIGSIPPDYSDLADDVADLSRQLSDAFEVVGNFTSVFGPTLVPFAIPANATVTIEEMAGGDLPTATVYWYNSSKVAIGSTRVNSSFGNARTVTLSLAANVAYVYLNTEYAAGIRIFIDDGVSLRSKVKATSEDLNNLEAIVSDEKTATELVIGTNTVLYGGPFYIPFAIPATATITIEEANGNSLPTCIVYFYNSSQTVIGSKSIDATYGKSRTVTLSYSENIAFLYLNIEYANGIRVFINNNGGLLSKVNQNEVNISALESENVDAVGYITSAEYFYHVFDPTTSLHYFKAYDCRLYKNGHAPATISWASLLAAGESYKATSPDGTTNCLAFSSNAFFCSYYNWTDGSVGIVTAITSIPKNSTILFACNAQAVYGAMVDYGASIKALHDNDSMVGERGKAITRFAEKIYSASGNTAKFGFFSDPHVFLNTTPEKYDICNSHIQMIEYLFSAAPLDFAMCGGDWLTSGATPNQAISQLGYATGKCKRAMSPFYNIVGNHDTNYLGTEELTKAQVSNAMGINNGGKCYYDFTNNTLHGIVLDTWDNDNTATMDAYKWEQVAWLADNLNGHANTIVFMHYIWTKPDQLIVSEFADNVSKLCDAFNKKATITLNGTTYDFTSSTGKVFCMIGGHAHLFASGTINDIPAFIVDKSANNQTAWYLEWTACAYLVCVDFENETIDFVCGSSATGDYSGTL